jgi:succinate dehydrogenase flavin-adding protein (antitoxin of CptAB toxin-antitoxin module)
MCGADLDPDVAAARTVTFIPPHRRSRTVYFQLWRGIAEIDLVLRSADLRSEAFMESRVVAR